MTGQVPTDDAAAADNSPADSTELSALEEDSVKDRNYHDDGSPQEASIPPPLLSKNQQKKLKKREMVAEKKRQRKLGDREAKRAQAVAQGRNLDAEAERQRQVTAAGTSQWRRKRQEQWETKQQLLAEASFQMCLDCSFEEHMTSKEIASLASQLRYCYSVNKNSPHPCLWAATSLAGETLDVVLKDKGYHEWSKRAYTGTGESLQDYYKDNLQNVVYLTSDSENVITELDNSKIYVIGGIVDRNRLKKAAYNRALELGVATAKLPLDEHLQSMPSTRVLTCNHVFELLLKYREHGNDWGKAMQDVLPSRKEAKLKKQQLQKNETNSSSPPKRQREPVEDDWGLSMDFHLFAQHQAHPVYYHDDCNSSFQVLCVEALTPVDMVNLGSGIHDATGHCVWTGAFLLVACWSELQPLYFADKRVVELGCGTGIGGLSLLMNHSDSSTKHASFVAFTDSDPEALALCQRNCDLNKLPNGKYCVLPLTWGEEPLPAAMNTKLPFDTVLATDVLYDIGLLPPLFQTAASCLSDNQGIFVLAHVPRACYNSQNPPVDNLEQYIVERAKGFGFALERLVRPLDDCCTDKTKSFPNDALNKMSLQEMHEIGAAVFVFRRAIE